MYHIPSVANEPVWEYAPGSPERAKLKETLTWLRENPVEVPLVIDGKEIRTARLIHLENSLDNKRTMSETEAPNTLRIPISLVRCWAA